uniref:hypothetical protein n=1 Tax=Bacteroides ovatus TaxID=28116 RepID=UPI001E59B08A
YAQLFKHQYIIFLIPPTGFFFTIVLSIIWKTKIEKFMEKEGKMLINKEQNQVYMLSNRYTMRP